MTDKWNDMVGIHITNDDMVCKDCKYRHVSKSAWCYIYGWKPHSIIKGGDCLEHELGEPEQDWKQE